MAVQEAFGEVVQFPVRFSGSRREVVQRDVPLRKGTCGGSVDYGFTGLKGLRLTRRGRVAVWVLALLAALGAGVFLGSVANADSAPAASAVEYYVVEQGDNLWEIAREINPAQDTRDTVAAIMELNGMSNASLFAGTTIVLPSFAEVLEG